MKLDGRRKRQIADATYREQVFRRDRTRINEVAYVSSEVDSEVVDAAKAGIGSMDLCSKTYAVVEQWC